MDTKELLYKAAQLKIQMKSLEEEYEELKPELEKAVITIAEEQGAEKEQVTVGELGKFCRVKGKTIWTYTPETQAKEKELKEIQAEEQANGRATPKDTFQIKFFAAKGESNG